MVLKPLHTGITVNNMKEALEWDEKNLGFRLVEERRPEGMHVHICFVQNGDFQLELFEHDSGLPLPDYRKTLPGDLQVVGTKHIAFGVADLIALKEQFIANGVEIANDMSPNVLFIRDNSGVLLEFNQL